MTRINTGAGHFPSLRPALASHPARSAYQRRSHGANRQRSGATETPVPALRGAATKPTTFPYTTNLRSERAMRVSGA